MAPRLAQSTKIFRHSKSPGQTTTTKGAKSSKKPTTNVVSDDSAIGADETFDFTGDTPTTLVAHQKDSNRRFESNLQQAGDPIALSVNFLPFRLVKGIEQ